MDAFRGLGGCQQRGKQFNVIEDETALTLTHAKEKGFDVLCVTYVWPIDVYRFFGENAKKDTLRSLT